MKNIRHAGSEHHSGSELPHEAVARLQLAAAVGVLSFRSQFVNVNTLQNVRSLQDLNLVANKALPAAGAAASTTALDLNTTTPGRVPRVELFVSVPAVPALVDAKTIIHVIEDSADNVTFAAVADLPSMTQLGAGGVGAAAVTRQFKAPIGLRRYVRLTSTVLAAGGDNTAVIASFGLVF
jgi:hypothetical protein